MTDQKNNLIMGYDGNGRISISGLSAYDTTLLGGPLVKNEQSIFVDWWYFSEVLKSLKVLGYREATVENDQTERFIDEIREKEDLVHKLKSKDSLCSVQDLPEFTGQQIEIQKRGVLGLLSRRVFGLFDEMGVGKTVEVVYAVGVLLKIYSGMKCLIISPKNVKYEWQSAFKKFLGIDAVFIEEESDSLIQLCHFEQVIDRTMKDGKVSLSKVRGKIKSEKFDLFVIDESHYVKNSQSKRAGAVKSFIDRRVTNTKFKIPVGQIDGKQVWTAGKFPYVWFLTGTPMEQAEDIYTFLKAGYGASFLSYREFMNNFANFKEIYIQGGRKIRVVDGVKNGEVLAALIGNISLKRSRSEIVEIDHLERKMILSLSREERAELKRIVDACESPLEKALRAIQFCNNPKLVGSTAKSPKMEALVEIVKSTTDKVVVWTQFRDGVDETVEALEKNGIKAVGFKGGDDMAEVKAKFEGPCQVIVSTIAKGAVGINFMKLATVVVYIEKPYSYTLWRQSHDRVMRIDRNMDKPVLFVELWVRNSLDRVLDKIIEKKIDLNKLLETEPDIISDALASL